MKNKLSKKIHYSVHNLFLSILQSKHYLYFKKQSLFYRGTVGAVLMVYGIISFIFPIIPLGVIAFPFGAILIFEPKMVKSKILYVLNVSRVKYFAILFYINFLHKWKQKLFSKNSMTKQQKNT